MESYKYPIIAGASIFGILTAIYLLKSRSSKSQIQSRKETLEKLYNLTIPKDKEQNIEIQTFRIYPIRGVRGIDVDEIKISNYGIKYDRDFAVYSPERKRNVGQGTEQKLSMIGIRIEKTESETWLVLYAIDKEMNPNEIRINLRVYNTGMFYSSKEYSIPIDCYEVSPEASEWISELIGKKIVLLRAARNLTKPVDRDELITYEKDDQTKGIISSAAIDIENYASLLDLKRYVEEKYKDDPDTLSKIEITNNNFRANVIINSPKAYIEDSVINARIGPALLRWAGWTSRCNAIVCNFTRHEENPDKEPLSSLYKYRKAENGAVFCIHTHADVFKSKEDEAQILGEDFAEEDWKDRKLVKKMDYVRIHKSEGFKVRVAVDRIKFK